MGRVPLARRLEGRRPRNSTLPCRGTSDLGARPTSVYHRVRPVIERDLGELTAIRRTASIVAQNGIMPEKYFCPRGTPGATGFHD